MRLAVCAVMILFTACSGPAEAPVIDAAVLPDTLTPPDIDRTKDESQLAPERAACTFGTGAWAAETIGTDYPVGADIPIDHVVVIMQENRSFDNYFGRLVADGFYQDGEVDVPPADWTLPDGNGGTVAWHPDDEYCFGLNHGWDDMHADWDNGAIDGFVTNNNPDGQRSMYYVDEATIPYYYALASTFAIGDRYFASVMTSTWPNRFYLMAGTSFGIGDNSFQKDKTGEPPTPQVFSMLQWGGHSWKDYTDTLHQVEFFIPFGYSQETMAHYGTVKCDLMQDIENDTLPDVSIIMGSELGGETTDEGPSALAGIGGQLVEQIVRAIMASPAWAHTAIFITYDENGGGADHVPPADACAPDDLMPHDAQGLPLAGDFTKTGFRVPFTVVSPYAKAHFVSHTVYDHTSILRFIESRFGLPALTARDANATPPMEMFDFAHPAFLTPPDITATTTVDPAILTQCNQVFAPTCGG